MLKDWERTASLLLVPGLLGQTGSCLLLLGPTLSRQVDILPFCWFFSRCDIKRGLDSIPLSSFKPYSHVLFFPGVWQKDLPSAFPVMFGIIFPSIYLFSESPSPTKKYVDIQYRVQDRFMVSWPEAPQKKLFRSLFLVLILPGLLTTIPLLFASYSGPESLQDNGPRGSLSNFSRYRSCTVNWQKPQWTEPCIFNSYAGTWDLPPFFPLTTNFQQFRDSVSSGIFPLELVAPRNTLQHYFHLGIIF